MTNDPTLSDKPLLIIGYGNTVRQDDQAGVLVAERIEAMALPGVTTLACPQLSPEHAAAVAQARAVVLVDAQAGPARDVRLQRIVPAASPQVTTHAAEPATLLALARDVFGHAPPAWLLTLPAERFGFGTDRSPATAHAVETAVGQLVEMARAGG